MQLYILFPRVLCKTIEAKETTKMEHNKEGLAPASPSAQYLNNSVLSISIIAVLETEIPFNDVHIMQILKDVFLPINPRFSSIMVLSLNCFFFFLMLFTLFFSLYMFQRRKYLLCGFAHLQNCSFFFLFYEIHKQKCMEG